MDAPTYTPPSALVSLSELFVSTHRGRSLAQERRRAVRQAHAPRHSPAKGGALARQGARP